MMGGGMMGWGGGMGLGGGGLLPLLFWAVLLAAAVVGIRWLWARGRPVAGQREGSPLEILERRYASGAIERDEFEAKRQDLRRG